MPVQPIHEHEMRECLRASYRSDPEANSLWVVAQSTKDPGSPPDQKGKQRLHPLLIVFAALAVLISATFLYFSLS